MKKRNILILLPAFLLASCGGEAVTSSPSSIEPTLTTTEKQPEDKEMSIIAPSGAPALGMVHYFTAHQEKSKIVAADSLAAEFIAKDKDAIIAPINLGVKMYNTNQNYKLFKTITWGNLYLVSRNSENIKTISELEGKTITAFGSKTVPEIVLTTVLKGNNVNATINFDAKEVNEVITQFVSKKASIILAAEPVLSKVKAKLGDDISIISLQDEYKKINKSSYPQAAIFVNKEYTNTYSTKYMDEMLSSIDQMKANPANSAKVAVNYDKSFATIGEEALTSAIPNCSFDYKTESSIEKSAVEKYLGYVEQLGFGATFGGTLPDNEFYI